MAAAPGTAGISLVGIVAGIAVVGIGVADISTFGAIAVYAVRNTPGDYKGFKDNSNKAIKGAGITYKSTTYKYKHSASKNTPWKDIVESTKNGPAKYKYGTDIEKLEMDALKNGKDVTNGKPWKVKEFSNIVGAKDGVETPYIRVEISPDGTIHSHPITPQEFQKLIKKR